VSLVPWPGQPLEQVLEARRLEVLQVVLLQVLPELEA